MNKFLWQASESVAKSSRLWQFIKLCETKLSEAGTQKKFATYDEFHNWSVEANDLFWQYLWQYAGVVGEMGDLVIARGGESGAEIFGTKFFPNGKLSFAENLLEKNNGKNDAKKNNSTAIIFKCEDKINKSITWAELKNLVSRLQQAFLAMNIKQGDRIAAMLPNCIETVACMLAANSIGAIWSSCSPDFGEAGILDRFTQISPNLFIASDGYWYNGKQIETLQKAKSVADKLMVKNKFIVPLLNIEDKQMASLAEIIAPFSPKRVTYKILPFNHPLYILFSSGTTGVPKCIVHGQGGTLLKHLSEHILHCDLRAGENIFYFTTCGWMMWNWLVSSLAVGATLVLYDGSPIYPTSNVLFDYIDEAKINIFGTSAKFIDGLRNTKTCPNKTHKLDSMRMLLSTGSPLSGENFHYVYENIKRDVFLASVSGGTDIVGCFVLGTLLKPVYGGEIQAAALGLDVGVFDEHGKDSDFEKGELVCKNPFPSMPIKFWQDENNNKYKNSYFAKFKNIWCHGDFAKWTKNGGMIIFGRSDATLNPGGVRIGTAEIYNIVEQIEGIDEAICIGQQIESDVRIILFVKLAAGVELTEQLKQLIKNKIKQNASPRHVPKIILAVNDIPRTRSGKIVELAVSDIVAERKVSNKNALANPQALNYFKDLAELKI